MSTVRAERHIPPSGSGSIDEKKDFEKHGAAATVVPVADDRYKFDAMDLDLCVWYLAWRGNRSADRGECGSCRVQRRLKQRHVQVRAPLLASLSPVRANLIRI